MAGITDVSHSTLYPAKRRQFLNRNFTNGKYIFQNKKLTRRLNSR
jgi:hypothetical protein